MHISPDPRRVRRTRAFRPDWGRGPTFRLESRSLAAPIVLSPLDEVAQARSSLAAMAGIRLPATTTNLAPAKRGPKSGPTAGDPWGGGPVAIPNVMYTTFVLNPSRTTATQVAFTGPGPGSSFIAIPNTGNGGSLSSDVTIGPIAPSTWKSRHVSYVHEEDHTRSTMDSSIKSSYYVIQSTQSITLSKSGSGNPGYSAGTVISAPNGSNVNRGFDLKYLIAPSSYAPVTAPITYQYAFSISYNPPNQGTHGLAEGFFSFNLTAPGIAATVSGNTLTVNYATSATTSATYIDSNFVSGGHSYSTPALTSNTITNASITTADANYRASLGVDSPNASPGFSTTNGFNFAYTFATN